MPLFPPTYRQRTVAATLDFRFCRLRLCSARFRPARLVAGSGLRAPGTPTSRLAFFRQGTVSTVPQTRVQKTLSSRPKQAAFSCARFVCAACVAEGPWQDASHAQITGTKPTPDRSAPFASRTLLRDDPVFSRARPFINRRRAPVYPEPRRGHLGNLTASTRSTGSINQR